MAHINFSKFQDNLMDCNREGVEFDKVAYLEVSNSHSLEFTGISRGFYFGEFYNFQLG